MWSSYRSLTVILVGGIVSGCAGHKANVEEVEEQKNQQTLNAYSHLTKIFDDCVERSARRQYASSGDLNFAIENGFLACNAEESAIIERLDVGVKNGFGQQQIGPYKFRLKQIPSKEQVEAEKHSGNAATDNTVRH